MSGPPLPLVSAFVQSVVRLVRGTEATAPWVFLYGERVRPGGGAAGPGNPVHDHLGLLVLRELLVELSDDAVHPGGLGRNGGAHAPHGELGGRRRGRRRGAAAGAACRDPGSCERDGSADRRGRSGKFHCSVSLPGYSRAGTSTGGASAATEGLMNLRRN